MWQFGGEGKAATWVAGADQSRDRLPCFFLRALNSDVGSVNMTLLFLTQAEISIFVYLSGAELYLLLAALFRMCMYAGGSLSVTREARGDKHYKYSYFPY